MWATHSDFGRARWRLHPLVWDDNSSFYPPFQSVPVLEGRALPRGGRRALLCCAASPFVPNRPSFLEPVLLWVSENLLVQLLKRKLPCTAGATPVLSLLCSRGSVVDVVDVARGERLAEAANAPTTLCAPDSSLIITIFNSKIPGFNHESRDPQKDFFALAEHLASSPARAKLRARAWRPSALGSPFCCATRVWLLRDGRFVVILARLYYRHASAAFAEFSLSLEARPRPLCFARCKRARRHEH